MEVLDYIKKHWPEARIILAIGTILKTNAMLKYWDEGYTIISLGKDEDPWKFINDADIILHGMDYFLNCYAIRKPILTFNIDKLSNIENREIIDIRKEWDGAYGGNE